MALFHLLPTKMVNNRIVVLCTFCLTILTGHTAAEWFNHGGDLNNRRSAPAELKINPITAPRLSLKWRFVAGFDISATPTVANGVVYFPSWNGNVYAVRADNGALIWKQNIGAVTGLPPPPMSNVTVSRASPTVAGDLLIVSIYGPAYVMAVIRLTGQLVWLTRLDPLPLGVVTASGTYFLGAYYVGVASLENTRPSSPCCTFRGSLVKLDARTGTILWQTYTIPDNGGQLGGYSGASIWGSSPAIDVLRQLVYVGTGQLYNAPAEVQRCQAALSNQTTPPIDINPCIGPEVHYDSIIAFDINSGQIKWATRLSGYDVFNFACLIPNNPDCPVGPNIDADFGEAPMLLSIVSNGRKRDVAVAVQKSGFAWALDRDNGQVVWFQKAGPGSNEGGGIWGAATDGIRVYTNIVNGARQPFTLAPSTQTTTSGGWVALDANTGQILWTTANPSNETAPGPVTIVNNAILFAGSVAPNGPFYAMDARTGQIIWSYNTGATIYGGASASYGCVFVGNGYSVNLAKLFHPTWTQGDSVFAFCV
ncbi:OLC1v1028012C1 [Oldenlandia corymbosa var. corymbosa]|uniref:OLC1v1028012C1 n=1 Tax=Oldenlandia corymbosa var. corymbosa TaxID=529605 RepID=A0AAV1CAR5_OLDCO|nr:OLC1v1028012C1 [Oldenlandia corymbosa var. corymbosa]